MLCAMTTNEQRSRQPDDDDTRETMPDERAGAPADEDTEFEYRPMPPKRSFTMRVRMGRPERGRPMPFSFDDDPA